MKRILINPPPSDCRCECCGRGGLNKQKTIRKDFRTFCGTTSAYWICEDCFRLDNASFKRKMNSTWKKRRKR